MSSETTAEQVPRRPRGVLRLFARWVQPGRNPSAVVFGNVTVAAICAIEASREHVGPRTVNATVLGTMLVYWFAHAYSEVAAMRMAREAPWSWRIIREGLRDEWPLLRGASLPLIAMLLALLLGGDGATCAAAGFWTALVALVLFEAYAARRAGEGWFGVATSAGVGVVLAFALVVLRTLVG